MSEQPETSQDAGATAASGPWVKLRSAAYQTFIYKRMISQTSPDARPGDVVTVFDRHGVVFGHALYNPNSQMVLRMLDFKNGAFDDAFWQEAIRRAAALRTQTLRLPEFTNAYRLVHAEGDDVSGLIVDRYADVLSIEAFSLGIWRRIEPLLPMLHAAAGTSHHLVDVDDHVQRQEAFKAQPIRSDDMPASTEIVENGVRFRVDFDRGHKTGFFCDQRENRRRFASLAQDADVLDACCYTGGFGVYAKRLGGAKDVTCVDLDENAIETARRNANLNQVRVHAIHADVFAYMRQMHENGRRYDLVVLDPPKLIFGRTDTQNGRQKYFDLNRLAAAVVRPGGLLLTCSCSGLLGRDEFLHIALGAARQADRHCQILDVTGAGPDHPVSPRCAESAYLKALWLRLST